MYKVTLEELKYLARCVELLKEQVEASCENKMESFVWFFFSEKMGTG